MQLALFATRRFAGLFWTQFLGAFNDNVFKNALIILVAYGVLQVGTLPAEMLVPLASGLFILPFFLCSALAGQLADKLAKPRMARAVKLAELPIMAVAAWGFATANGWLLLATLFLMGTQSAFFGPVKYGIVPELVSDRELVGANGLIQSGTFLAILLGTILGGVLAQGGATGLQLLGPVVITLAAAGIGASLWIPARPPAQAALPVHWNPVGPIADALTAARRDPTLLHSILGGAWFWFYGSVVLALLPLLAQGVLGVGEGVVTTFLALFCVGSGVGALLCERLSGEKVELGLVPLGSLGLTGFAVDLWWATATWDAPGLGAMLTVPAFFAHPGAWRIAADLVGLAVFGGFFVVPLQSLVQQRAVPAERARIIAASNVVSAAFMVAAAVALMGFLAAGVTTPQVLLIVALMNAAVATYIYRLIPEFLLRFIAWVLAHVVYRLRIEGRDRIPPRGPALLVCNHVSFVDWLIIASASQRPIRFVMYHGFMKVPLLSRVFRDAKVIPIAPAKEDPAMLDAAFEQIAEDLTAGRLVCLFPEGRLTADGSLMPFRRGAERILARTPVPVVPLALRGLWGSFFSRFGSGPLRRPFRRVWSRVTLMVGEPLRPEEATVEVLEARVAALADVPVPTPPPAVADAAPPTEEAVS